MSIYTDLKDKMDQTPFVLQDDDKCIHCNKQAQFTDGFYPYCSKVCEKEYAEECQAAWIRVQRFCNNRKFIIKCIECGRTLENYKSRFCCHNTDCGCQGLPIDPPLCEACGERFFKPAPPFNNCSKNMMNIIINAARDFMKKYKRRKK